MGEFLSAAYKVLQGEKRPLTAREITAVAISRGLLKTQGKTPWQTMKSKLSTDILLRQERSPFMRTEKGHFALREWRSLDEHIADRFQKALFDEDIVVIPRGSLQRYVPSLGLHPSPIDSKSFRSECLAMRRRLAEDDPSVIQLVSVFVLKYRDKYLTYKRTKRLPESRLHGFYSVAFGGHLNPDDLPGLFDVFNPEQGRIFLIRELAEEVKLPRDAIANIIYRGLLYDDSRPVSRQHLGIVFDVILRSGEYKIGERGFLMDHKYETLTEILARSEDFENWSTLLVRLEAESIHRVEL